MRIFTFIAAVIFMIPTIAGAQFFGEQFERIAALNKNNPAQSDHYKTGQDILGRHIVDSKNKVVGDVEDVLLKTGGAIDSVYIDMNRLNLGEKIYMGYRRMNMRPVGSGYQLPFEDDQVEAIYPQILANMATAAGEKSDLVSLQNIMGRVIYNEKGGRVGIIETVLFSRQGDRAEGVYIEMKQGTRRGDKIALPFYGLDYSDLSKITIPESYEQAMLDYVKSR